MITQLNIEEGSELHKLLGYTTIETKPLTILMGPNGVGKSSILQGLAGKFERFGGSGYYGKCGESISIENEGDYELRTLKARQDNGKYRGYFEDTTLDLITLFQSEGQSTMTVFFNRLEKILKESNENGGKNVVFLIDEIDSGVSFDNVLQIVGIISNVLKKFPNLQIIMTAHNYEFARRLPENTFWVPVGKFINMSDYEIYRMMYEVHLMEKMSKERGGKKG